VTKPLTLERFRALVLAYGGSSELWPEAERQAALLLCAASAEARALVAAEAELDTRLATGAAPPEPRAELLRRLNEVPLRAPQRRAWWPFRNAWVPAFGWALAAAVGLGWGLDSAPLEDELTVGATVAAVDSAAPDTVSAEDDLTALAGGALSELEE
jgi:hypothetical protein